MKAKIVLVRTLYDSNIGSVSRVMSNMGIEDLILLQPECKLTYSAQQAAASGQEGLRHSRTYSSWDDLLRHESEGLRIGLTVRGGRERDVRPLTEILQLCESQHCDKLDLPIYLIFGPENWGLSNEDLEHTHFAASLPWFGENSSYNLSHAALLALYLFHQVKATPDKSPTKTETEDLPAANFPDNTVKLWLESLGFDVTRTGVNVYSVLKRLLLHSVPTEKEVRTLEVVLHQSIRKMKEYNWLRQKVGSIERQEDIFRP